MIARPLTAAAIALSAAAAQSAPPDVAADILPVHGLVARVMDGVGAPDLILPAGASPHGHAMKPSEAGALERADLVFWVGPDLTPWLAGPIATLASHSTAVALLDAPGTTVLPFREAEDFGDEDGHDDHGQDHHGRDPHAWLDPENGRAWLSAIAEALATADPENAAIYRANAAAGVSEIAMLETGIDERLAPLRDRPFVVFHDATQYFEARFGLKAAGALSLGDGASPGPATVATIHDRVLALGISCALAEPQVNPGLLAAVTEGSDARTATLDPLGTAIPEGPGFYPALIDAVAAEIAGCL